MRDKIAQIIKELTISIELKELELSDIVEDTPSIILMMETAFEELKSLISEYQFSNNLEEITFFKETKPKLFSKLIYYRKIYYLELNRPVAGYDVIKKYLQKEQCRIHFFSERNADFIQYYRSGKTILDEFYFLRDRREFELNLESFYFERDPRFSTNFDFKVAKLLANDMLAAYLNCQLAKLKHQEESNSYFTNEELPSTEWTDKKTALAEIIYAIHEEKSVNAGKAEIKALATIFGRIFEVDLSDIYHIFLEIRSRKTNRTEYLNRLVNALNRRMDDADNK